MNTDSFGSADGTYFVSRSDLLQWVNQLCRSNIVKVEELATGAIFCQIFNEYLPGKIQMSKVNWNAKYDYEYIANFKLLQQGFTKCSIPKTLEIEKLVRGKCQDNLEMLQWMKKHFENSYVLREKRGPTPTPRLNVLSERNSVEKIRAKARSSMEKIRKTDKIPVEKLPLSAKPVRSPEKSQSIDTSKIAIDTLKKERDFYFEKLREIELQVQEYPDKDCDLIKRIQKILYSEDI